MATYWTRLRTNVHRIDRNGWATIWRPLIFIPFYLAILLPAAGTWRYTGAWLLVLSTVLYLIAYSLLLIPSLPELINERGRPFRKDTQPFDMRFFLVWRSTLVMQLLLAGIDRRFGWSHVDDYLMWLAFAVSAVLNTLSIWPMTVNRHFEVTVRLQTDRHHQVVDTGPYSIVRHPGYSLIILASPLSALMLESYWALIPSLVVAVAFMLRTHLEDRTLREGLEGYEEYSSRVRWRLLPGIW